jgi:hypothetical protein
MDKDDGDLSWPIGIPQVKAIGKLVHFFSQKGSYSEIPGFRSFKLEGHPINLGVRKA